jgi:membrane fusion protein, multidrug efflux system
MTDIADPTDPAAKRAPPNTARRTGLLILFAVLVVVLAGVGLWQLLVGRWHVTTENAYVGAESAQVTAQTAGTISEVLVSEAVSVQAGQLLVRLDRSDAEIALAAAEADLEKARRNVRQLIASQAVSAAQVSARAADTRRAQVSARQAVADAGRARAEVRRVEAGTAASIADLDRLRAQVTQLDAQTRQSQLAYERLVADRDRRRAAIGDGAVSDEALAHAESAAREAELAWRGASSSADVARASLVTATTQIASSRAAVDAAREQATAIAEGTEGAGEAVARAQADLLASERLLDANATMIEGVTVDTHPDVLRAMARVRQAQLDLDRTEVRAPFAGIIARRSIQTGQRVAQGAPLMTVVPVDRLFVDANFKESQLARVLPGQLVELKSDLYGGSVVYHGTVIGIGGGTGSAFALLPAQNASGNWIKVVQRVPVRIALDQEELARHPLRVGLSMQVSINIRPRQNQSTGTATR